MDIILKYFDDFSDEQITQFKNLGPLYKEWNEKINVISRKDIDSLYEKHILHSLSIAATFELSPGMQVMDLGSGGGFPGLPLAIFFPDVHFHLVDSIAKKLKVVEAIKETIGIKNITTQHARAEDIKDKKFDLVVSRAVAPLKNLWHWSRPLLKNKMPTTNIQPGLICLKGGDLAAEIHESQTRPSVVEISSIFQESFFKEKYLLYVKK